MVPKIYCHAIYCKKPYNSVLIVREEGLRYRLQEDHFFKDIRYNQITGITIKSDLVVLFCGYILGSIQLLFFVYLSFFQGLDMFYGIELVFWTGYLLFFVLIPFNHSLLIHKGSLGIEVYKTSQLRQVKQIKKEIESHL